MKFITAAATLAAAVAVETGKEDDVAHLCFFAEDECADEAPVKCIADGAEGYKFTYVKVAAAEEEETADEEASEADETEARRLAGTFNPDWTVEDVPACSAGLFYVVRTEDADEAESFHVKYHVAGTTDATAAVDVTECVKVTETFSVKGTNGYNSADCTGDEAALTAGEFAGAVTTYEGSTYLVQACDDGALVEGDACVDATTKKVTTKPAASGTRRLAEASTEEDACVTLTADELYAKGMTFYTGADCTGPSYTPAAPASTYNIENGATEFTAPATPFGVAACDEETAHGAHCMKESALHTQSRAQCNEIAKMNHEECTATTVEADAKHAYLNIFDDNAAIAGVFAAVAAAVAAARF